MHVLQTDTRKNLPVLTTHTQKELPGHIKMPQVLILEVNYVDSSKARVIWDIKIM